MQAELTVMHSHPDGEIVVPAHRVEFRRRTGNVVVFNEVGYVVAEIGEGTVFVMNTQGQTVARYQLEAKGEETR